MVLTDKEIRNYSQNKEAPLIAPFHEEQLQAASYDVTLSGKITTFKKAVQTIDLKLTLQAELDRLYDERTLGVDGYIIQPGEYILAELQETLSIPSNMAAHLRPRTRFTRIGLLLSAQHCNPTYTGKLYVGLFNAGPNALQIKKGIAVGQVVFDVLSQEPSDEKLYKNKPNSAYMNEGDTFRGSVLGEKGWEDVQSVYDGILERLKTAKEKNT